MAEMGAEIIKVELAPMGDFRAGFPIGQEGRSGYFVQQNRGKKSICLDLNKPESLEILRAMVPKVDIVVENFGPGVMQKRGLDYDSLKLINPRLIMASLSAFGRKSPLSHQTGYDMIAQAFSGMMHMTGDPEGAPTFVGIGVADVGTGVHTFAALGYALYNREKTGVGQYIDIAMIDALYHMHDFGLQSHSITDGQFIPKRMGRYRNQICPAGVFKGPQGWIFILVLDRQWGNMAKAMGRPELRDDPRFATGADRVKNRDVLNPIVEQWLASMPSDDAAVAALEENRVACAPVLSVTDTMKTSVLQGAQHGAQGARSDPRRSDNSRLSAEILGLPGSAGHPGSPFGRAWRTGTQGSAGLLGRPNCEAEGGRNPLQRESLARTLAKKIPLSGFLPQN